VSGAVARGTGPARPGGWPGEDQIYARLRELVAALLRYPDVARRRGLVGTVVVDVVIQPSGQISSVRVVESSAHKILDDAAVETVLAVGSVPLPRGVPPFSALKATLPVVFEQR
jgi:TonB family protein